MGIQYLKKKEKLKLYNNITMIEKNYIIQIEQEEWEVDKILHNCSTFVDIADK